MSGDFLHFTTTSPLVPDFSVLNQHTKTCLSGEPWASDSIVQEHLICVAWMRKLRGLKEKLFSPWLLKLKRILVLWHRSLLRPDGLTDFFSLSPRGTLFQSMLQSQAPLAKPLPSPPPWASMVNLWPWMESIKGTVQTVLTQ